MPDAWRLRQGGTVRDGEDFTSLRAIIKRLVDERCPFKVGFGESLETVIEPPPLVDSDGNPIPQTRTYPEDMRESGNLPSTRAGYVKDGRFVSTRPPRRGRHSPDEDETRPPAIPLRE